MEPVRYHFSQAINCMFELPTEAARKLLPKGVEPVEPNHGASLMGVTLFDFSDSPLGPYQELVFSLYVVPRLGIMEQHPHGAVYPVVVASSSQEARDHAISLWHLPHFEEDIYIEFEERPDGKGVTGTVYCHQRQPIVSLTVSESGKWNPSFQLYQSFQYDASGAYMGVLDMQGRLSEHEENTGSIHLYHEHRFFDSLDLSALDIIPFREMWMKEGVESYHDLISLN
jgi:hypothetical protein